MFLKHLNKPKPQKFPPYMEKKKFDITPEIFIPNNLTTTFSGIGYVIVDVNAIIILAVKKYRLNIKQIPFHTIMLHFNYISENMKVSSLRDLQFLYEFTGDPYFDVLIAMLDDGTFSEFSTINFAIKNDRIGFIFTSIERTELIHFAHKGGLYVVIQESTYFEYPFAHSQILKPSSYLSDTIEYHCIPAEKHHTVSPQGEIPSFGSRELRENAFITGVEIRFSDCKEEIQEDIAKALIKCSREGRRILFDGRIYMNKYERVLEPRNRDLVLKLQDMKLAPETDQPGNFVLKNMPLWGGKDLDLIIPPIPEKPNLKHLANIRRSALSMYEQSYQYSMLVNSEKPEKPKKVSAKVQNIIDANNARIAEEKRKKDNEWLEGFFGTYSRLNGLSAKKKYIEGMRMKNEYINNKLLLLKIELYGQLWDLEKKKEMPEEKVLIPLYLTIMEYIEKTCMKNSNLGKDLENSGFISELEFVLSCFIDAGFEATVREIIERYALPVKMEFKTNATAAPNDIDLYFQLKFVGEHLKRTLGTRKDARVPFDPDKWQVDLLNAVDMNKSAVIAAPTSSGKTFACFYTIEKMLKNSDTDVVIFCLPTKALANQVSADIYARFSPKNCRMALQGMLMNDRCAEPFTSQVVITIPSMLESLLNSCVKGGTKLSKNAMNAERIKYIIIDEVHKINDPSIGLSIERIINMAECPLLLLSATIGNLNSFYKWFKDIELSKGRESELITHNERFCELKPYVWSRNNEDDINNSNRLLPLNCMFAYSFSHLKEFGFGNDINFLPEELLNLYYYIYMVLKPEQKKKIKKLAPKNFFKSNIISKAEVKQYEMHLLKTFEKWLKDGVLSEDQVKEVYRLLVGNTLDAFPLVCDEAYLMANLLPLLMTLRDQNMMPVIIFNTNRELVSRMAKVVYEELENMDIKKKKDKFAEKIKKEFKRNRDNEKTKNSWIEESIASEQNFVSGTRDIKYTFLDPVTKLTDVEIKEELSEVRNTSKYVLEMVYRGIGVHHAGMERRYRSAIEILFRKKHVRVIFATETLALGINMPCRTVVFAGDSLKLDPMNYKQMAGRAGRRGYDTLGNMVYFGISKSRVQNLMVSMLPEITGLYTFSNSSFVSFKIDDKLIKHSLLGQIIENKKDEKSNKIEKFNNDIFIFKYFQSEELRRELVNFQKTYLSSIYPSNYLWDLYISNRCHDNSIFLFALLVHCNKISWDPDFFIITVAHLFEVRPCLDGYHSILPPMPRETTEFVDAINTSYKTALNRFYSPELRTLSGMTSDPLHYIKSFIYSFDIPKNNYIYEFFKHGSSKRIFLRNGIQYGDLWQSLYNIDYMLASLINLIKNLDESDDLRLKNLNKIYDVFHSKFKAIFS